MAGAGAPRNGIDAMGGSSDWIEVIVLAAIAAFVAWRLFATLGSRTGHEPPPVERRPVGDESRDIFHASRPATPRASRVAETVSLTFPESMPADLQAGLKEIATLDTRFSPEGFLAGARAAYQLILEHFWQGDTDDLKPYLGDDAHFAFARAISSRAEAEKTVNSQLSVIKSADITQSELVGTTAHITVRFVSTVLTDGKTATVTDDWTFSRHTQTDDPNWMLIATDDSIGA
jgi:predicted lipid-binding transport protein (Tim44 family)